MIFPNFNGLLIVRGGLNPSVESVVVEGFESPLQPVQVGLKPTFSLLTHAYFIQIAGDQLVLHPIDDLGGNHQFPQSIGEAVRQNLFARISLWALPAISRAVVVHVSPFLLLAHERTAAMAAPDQAAKSKIVRHLAVPVLMATVEDLLAALPDYFGDQRLVTSLV